MFALTACGGGGGGGGDGGGEALALGQKAVVGHVELTGTGKRGKTTQVGLTVLRVRKGTQEELKKNGLTVGKDSQDTVPYYVDARFENQGTQTVKRSLDVSLEDSDGNLIGRTLFFNYGDRPFPPCTEITEGAFKPGESYESCTLTLVPDGVEVGKVSFLSDKGADTPPEFVYWEAK